MAIIRYAYRLYHGGKITLEELLRTVNQWRR